MDIYEAIEKRYSVRSYEDKDVEDQKLRRVLDAGRNAPSAHNRQEWKFIVVRDAETRDKLADAAGQAWIKTAPMILAVVGLTKEEMMYCDVPADPIDCSIATDHMTLAAVAEGLGTCWIGHFKQAPCKKILSVPDSCWIIELMAMGYPAGPPKTEKPRKPFEQVVCFEKFE